MVSLSGAASWFKNTTYLCEEKKGARRKALQGFA
jgi:hypothetical protein